jgi:hypothetical protein
METSIKCTRNLVKAISMDDVGRFCDPCCWITFFHGFIVGDELQASILKLDDVVREQVSHSETHVLQSSEFTAFLDQATKEVPR